MAELTPTKNQGRAITEYGKNYVVVAGAGAGKTRVLVERFLTLLERCGTLPSIVAITFTEKAASEMRDRVRRAIEDRAADTTAPDAANWAQHRAEIDAAQISTIHSLCARLLRANPAEAKVDPQFDVLEEADAAILQDKAIDAVLTELAESGGEALGLLTEYEVRTVRETLRTFFQRGAAVDQAFACLPENIDALFADWQTRLQSAQRDAMARLLNSSAWRDATEWISTNAGKKADDRLEIVRAELERLLIRLDPADYDRTIEVLRQIGDTKVGNVGTKAAWDDPKAARQVVITLRDLAKVFKDAYDLALDENDRRAAALVFQWRTLWLSARTKYAELKTAQRVLDFNDLEEEARALLNNHSEVRERYHREFACLLVDEFQDTNAAQRDIIYALASPAEADRLFIVADGKQSIYGFRGADVSVFTETKEDIRKNWGDDALIPLAESFRAPDRLVKAFNYLFERILAVEGDREPFEIAYEPMQGVRPSLGREPLIEIIRIPEDEISPGERREREAEELSRRLQQLVDDHFQVWDKGEEKYRDIQWGDIAFLFRATTHFTTYEDAFKAAHIPYVTLAGKGYYDRAEVRDLIQLLRALDNSRDDLAVATVLRSPLYALSDETLYRLRRPGQSFRETLNAIPADIVGDERARVEFAHSSLEKLWARVGRVPILDLLKGALADTDYLAALTSLTDGNRRRANVEKLLALARRTGLVRLSDLNAYLLDLTVQEVREGEAVVEAEKAVRLMSIHRAKGLEFPIVVIPDASRAPRESSDTLLTDQRSGVAVTVRDPRGKRVETVAYQLLKLDAIRRDDAEEKRLLYVAMTRAQDYLIVSGGTKAKGKSYLSQILGALGEETTFEWGTVKVREPTVDFDSRVAAPSVAIEETKIEGHAAVPLPAELPQLALPLALPTVRELHSFAPTGLEQLVRGRVEFERRVLEGAPERVMPVTRSTESTHAPAYVVGEIAHRAIQRWRFPDTTPNLETILEGYAQERGLTDLQEIRDAVREATGLLHKFMRSNLYREMEQAVVRRHEVPFVVQWEGRMVHGALDSMCQSANGHWFIVDFKTDRFREKGTDAKEYALKEYGVQLALYQYAVATQFSDVPVRVHYIREGETVSLTQADLADAQKRAVAALS